MTLMQLTLNDVLLKILNIINYLDNQEKFIKEFEELNRVETIMNLLERLPKEMQDKIKAEKDQQMQLQVLSQLVPQAAFIAELARVSHQALLNFLKDIEHTLSVEQKEKIAALFPQR